MAPSMSINHAVVSEVRDLINERGGSISWLARTTGISRATLVNYITRERSTMPVDVMEQVARALDLTLYELAKRAEDRREAERRQAATGTDGPV